ncbi:hypothetical protein GCM10022204_31070 [Microlunatus aurantiacus]|uniref:Uncharacterized protein n=1 Tax=Microlunatus aurantiacus TaxID=446786 RepID=A0ABP7DXR7_9ACTN
MTGILIVIAAVALLIAALSPAHHRARTPWRPGADVATDRDRQRVADELTATAQRAVRGPRRLSTLLDAAGSAVPFHRSAPRLRSH